MAQPNTPDDGLRITVAGAGAIGCTLAVRLAAAGHHLSLLARGATLAAAKADGIQLNDRSGTTTVQVTASDQAEFGIQDILFLCSKSQDLPALSGAVRPLIGPETLIVPTPNGVPFWYFHGEGGRFDGQPVNAVDPDGQIGRHLPLAQIIGAVVFMSAEMSAPGRVVSRTPHRMMLGEPTGPITDRLRRLCAVLEGAGIEARAVEQIRDPLWTKIIANLTSNPLSVVSGATLEAIYTRPDLLAIVRPVMNEAMLTAACYRARLTADPIGIVALGAGMGAVRTSMLQDHRRGRPLELAAIGDAVIELAERYDLPMTATRELLERARHAPVDPC
ncbi:ketopantoate reductase family protein [Acidisphaera sp. S103]|uniref:ketopantoate reductase family protein n=1 Tax=Acidisphaera sp. S103 TaxID=1747223 RepID=UPI00131DA132|nr:2-dehydropantoate 2-reductase [Acidisphaera sp. S103]